MVKRVLRAIRVTVIIGIVLILTYSFVGLVGVPWAIKSQVVPELAQRLGKPVSVKEVKFNPFGFTLGVEGLAVDEPDGSPLFGFDELFVDFDMTSVFGETYQFDAVRLILPYSKAVIQSDGSFNLANMGVPSDVDLPPAEPDPSPQESNGAFGLPPIDVALFTIEQGFVEFRDQSRPKEFIADIVPIQLTLRNFSTRKGREQSYFIVAEREEGEVMQWDGTLSLQPLQSEGRVDLKGIDLRGLLEFIQGQQPYEVTKGVLDVGGRYLISGKDTPDIVFSEGAVQLREVQLRATGHKEEILGVPHIAVTGVFVDVPRQEVVINSLQSRGSRLKGWLTREGHLNLHTLFGGNDSDVSATLSQNPKDSAGNQGPWNVIVKDLMFTGFSLDFEDRMPEKPVAYQVAHFDLNATNIRSDLTQPIQVDGGLTLNEAGIVKVKGSVGFNPLLTDLSLDLSNIGLRPFQSYLSSFAQFELAGGSASFKGSTHYQEGSPNTPRMRMAGALTTKDVTLMDPVQAKQILGWNKMAFRDLTVELDPIRVAVGELQVNEPSLQVVRGPDGEINFSRVFSTIPSSGVKKGNPASKSKNSSTSRPVISVKTVQLVDLAASFTDQSVEPPVVTHIQELSGSIKGLSTKHRSRADVALIGTVDDVATLRVEGQINPLEKDTYTDLAVFLTNWDLTTVSPYAGKYIGYPINKGKVSLNLQYTLLDNILAGENEVIADQLTLGDRVESPDASDLPVPLAMALLKDRDGRIDIDLPVRGDLNDPEFSYGGILWQSFLNLIMKAVSSPFALVGDLLGVNAEDLEYVGFRPGRAELSEEEQIKLERVVGALDLRPGLRLEIRGQADPLVDGQQLAEEQLMAAVLDRARQERRTLDSQSVKLVESEKERDERIIIQLFGEKFPGQMSLLGTPSRAEDPIGQGLSSVPSVEEMKRQLIASIPIDQQVLQQLAQERARRIRDFLVRDGGVSEERVFLVEGGADATGSEDVVKTTLALTVR